VTDRGGHAHAPGTGLGIDESDGSDLRHRKGLLVRFSLFTLPAALLWGALYWAAGEPGAGLVPWAYAAVVVVAVALFAMTRSFALVRDLFLAAILVAPALMTILLGGFDAASAVILWSLLCPLAAIAFAGIGAARWWFAGFVAALVAGVLLPSLVRPVPAELPETLHLAMLVLNIGAVSLLAFVLVASFARQREDALARADALLLNILPPRIADLLKARHGRIAEQIEAATIVFADVVDFTPLSSRLPPGRVVDLLDHVFSTFDDLAERYGLDKIKTIGDCYMAASGVTAPRSDHAQAAAEMALAMAEAVDAVERDDGTRLSLRIGINSGPVVAGVIGRKRFIYDLWGDVVNTASRMESHGAPGRIQITESTFTLLGDEYECVPRGRVEVKGKGEVHTWFLLGRRAAAGGAPEPRAGTLAAESARLEA
jgi:guanylate cyclase